MKQECFVNRNKVLDAFRKVFGVKSDFIDPKFFTDMQHANKWLRDAWDKACDLDREWYVEQETIQNTCVFVTRDAKHSVMKLSIAIHGGWDEYESDAAQRKYDAIKAPHIKFFYND